MPTSRVATRQQLLRRGFTPRSLAAAVQAGRLIRVRRGYYATPDIDDLTEQAVRVGGLLTCVSAAKRAGIWVAIDERPHIYLRHEASRMRTPQDRFRLLSPENHEACTLHWSSLVDPANATMESVAPLDSLAHIIRCQPEALAIAAIDSARNQGIVGDAQLDTLFTKLPAKYSRYQYRVDGRAMSGIETIVRLILVDAGFHCVPQVFFDRVGTVDLVVERCVVIETDGRLGHSDAEGAHRDYDRDVALAALGYIVLRFNYRQVMYSPEVVLDAVRGALSSLVRAR